ncbi:MAG TPA: hypothetical protein VFE78_34725 [Gemmataceae bacterium]|jgi:hypothetical protein|nr:hypothetical protein [Gemmataceae bacterium]
MKTCAAFLALGALVLADSSALAQRGRRGAQAGRNGWLNSLEQGKAQARETGKPLMVVLRCEP